MKSEMKMIYGAHQSQMAAVSRRVLVV